MFLITGKRIKMKKEKPILFSTEMVRAILEGRKTMTRRIVKPQPIDNVEVDGNFFHGAQKGYVKVDGHPDWQRQFAHEFSPFKVGTILWVKETFENAINGEVVYKADGKPPKDKAGYPYPPKWKPSLFMPRKAARIFLEVTDVRVERLYDVSEDDAIKEGSFKRDDFGFDVYRDSEDKYTQEMGFSFKNGFQSIWQTINGEESWNENPFVWVIEFKKLDSISAGSIES